MANLELNSVSKSFGKVEVIRDVNLSINDGEFVVFVGPSGCGKSTLLRLVAGLEQASSGDIVIGGENVTHADPADRGVAMVFQSYALYPHMTVAENMGFGLKMTGMDKADVAKRVEFAAHTLHLEELLQRKPKQLSGGQRQRVAIGRAIVRQPKVFLFDEPLSNLDAELRVQMRLELAKLHKELDATMIYVTHDQVEAMTLADKIVVLRDGRIEQIGSPIELYDNPANVFVAGFIGSPRMNFIRAVLDQRDAKRLSVSLPEFDDARVQFKGEVNSASEEFLLGIRPEHFDLKTESLMAPADQVSISTRVDVIENLGSSAFAYTRNDDNTPKLTIDLGDSRHVRESENLNVAFKAEDCLLFDQQDQRRIYF